MDDEDDEMPGMPQHNAAIDSASETDDDMNESGHGINGVGQTT
jgi:hypothetical protein